MWNSFRFRSFRFTQWRCKRSTPITVFSLSCNFCSRIQMSSFNVSPLVYPITKTSHIPVLYPLQCILFLRLPAFCSVSPHSPHCKPGKVYSRFITATCEAGPGTTHMCTFEICVWSLQILGFADRCVFNNSIQYMACQSVICTLKL